MCGWPEGDKPKWEARLLLHEESVVLGYKRGKWVGFFRQNETINK